MSATATPLFLDATVCAVCDTTARVSDRRAEGIHHHGRPLLCDDCADLLRRAAK